MNIVDIYNNHRRDDMSDVNCPYCLSGQEINHDDGQGFEEDVFHEQECHDCEKTFTFTTTIIYYYEAEKADCLNGGEHELEPVKSYPNIYPDWVRCKNCEHEEKGELDQAALDNIGK